MRGQQIENQEQIEYLLSVYGEDLITFCQGKPQVNWKRYAKYLFNPGGGSMYPINELLFLLGVLVASYEGAWHLRASTGLWLGPQAPFGWYGFRRRGDAEMYAYLVHRRDYDGWELRWEKGGRCRTINGQKIINKFDKKFKVK